MADASNHATVEVSLGARAYPILIGSGLLSDAATEIARALPGRKYAIVADMAVLGFAEPLAASLERKGLLLGPPISVPSGEASKGFGPLERVCDALLALGIERGHAIVAVGGGVIGDLAGFAAAIVKRGVTLVQVPTTLLAQVDSSVGGKTGINTAKGKNLVGAFYQPSLVLADLDTLKTLPPREFRAGYAEVVKYGALGNRTFFEWLQANRSAIFSGDQASILHAVKTSCEMKAAIVARDEFETGERALLNLGHTFGHAVEAWAGYNGTVLHGEAVALGMVLAAEFSYAQGLCSEDVPGNLRSHLSACGFAVDFPGLERQTGSRPTVETLIGYMLQDKKVVEGAMTLILLRAIGAAVVVRDVPVSQIRDFLGAKLAI